MAIVTISRGSMSGGESFANCLASRLGYPVIGREVLVEAASRLGVTEDVLREKIQTSADLFEKLTTDRHIYLVALQSALADRCVSGNLIYHGHAGHFLLKEVPNVLRVRLIAPMSMRVRAVMEQQGLAPEAAQEYIRYVDQERIEWTKFVYGVDWRDPRNYDIIINLRRVSLAGACAMVSGMLQTPAYATTEDVKKKLRDFALACRVKVALVAKPICQSCRFDVYADDGTVVISWQRAALGVPTKSLKTIEEEARRTAEAVEGVRKVTLNFSKPSSSDKAA
jgi:cytidylate kinase